MGPTRRTPSRRGLGGWNLRALLFAVAGILHTRGPDGQLAGALRKQRFWLPADNQLPHLRIARLHGRIVHERGAARPPRDTRQDGAM
jgi:hypothetical protein